MADTELRTATEALAGDMADDDLLPITKAAGGSGLFRMKFSTFKTWLLAGGGLLPALTGNSGKALFVKTDESGVEWKTAASGGGSSGYGAHRYWRLKDVFKSSGSGAAALIGELYFRKTDGTSITYTCTAWSSVLSGNPTYAGTKMNDGDAGSIACTDSSDAHPTYTFDFATPQEPMKIGIKIAGDGGWPAQGPHFATLQYSNDNTTWTDATPITWGAFTYNVELVSDIPQPVGTYSVPAGGTDGQILAKASDTNGDTEWIDAPTGGGGGGGSGGGSAAIGAWRYWAVLQIELQNNGEACCMGELQFRTVAGGAPTVPTVATAQSGGSYGAILNDGNAATEADNMGRWYMCDFGSPIAFTEMFFQARSDYGGGANQAISRCLIAVSDDKLNWRTVSYVANMTYASPGSSNTVELPANFPGGGGSAPAIDTSGFTIHSADVVEVIDDALGVRLSAPSTATMYSYEARAITADAPFDMIARVQGGSFTQYSSIGIFARESSSGNGLTAMNTWGGSNWGVESDTVGGGARVDGNGVNIGGGSAVWLRIYWDGATDVHAYGSCDGITWALIRSYNGGTIAIDQIGIMARKGTSGGPSGIITRYDDGVISWGRPDGGSAV